MHDRLYLHDDGYVLVCAWCGRVRDDDGAWQRPSRFGSLLKEVELTHGMCPDCEQIFRSEG